MCRDSNAMARTTNPLTRLAGRLERRRLVLYVRPRRSVLYIAKAAKPPSIVERTRVKPAKPEPPRERGLKLLGKLFAGEIDWPTRD